MKVGRGSGSVSAFGAKSKIIWFVVWHYNKQCHSLKSISFTVILGHFLLRLKSMSVFHMTSVVNRLILALIFFFPRGANRFWWLPLRGLIKQTVIDNVLSRVWPLAAWSGRREWPEGRGISSRLCGAAESSPLLQACDIVHLIQVCGEVTKYAFNLLQYLGRDFSLLFHPWPRSPLKGASQRHNTFGGQYLNRWRLYIHPFLFPIPSLSLDQ